MSSIILESKQDLQNSKDLMVKDSKAFAQYQLQNVRCAGCVRSIENSLKELRGVMHAEVNLALSNCRVEYDSDRLSDNEIHSLLSQKGYSPQKLQSNNLSSLSVPDSSQENSNWKWALVGTLPLFVLAMGPMANLQLPAFFDPSESPTAHVLTQWILILPVLWAGRDFYKNGFRSLMRWSPDMDTLVALGTGGSTALELCQLHIDSARYFSH